jgi:protein TonB
MTRIRLALILSLALHAGLLLGLPAAPPATDRAASAEPRIAVALVAPEPADPTRVEPESPLVPEPPPEPVPEPIARPEPTPEPVAKPPRPIERASVEVEVVPSPPSVPLPPATAPQAEAATRVVTAATTIPDAITIEGQARSALDVDDLALDYKRALQAAIARNKRYPRMARRLGQEGTVEVGFVILNDGRLQDVRVVRGSGHAPLDRAAVDSVHRLGRFRPIPPELQRESWALVVPMSYDLL